MKRSRLGLMLIPVRVAGLQQAALIDTGAGMTVIDQALVDAQPEAFEAVSPDDIDASFVDTSGKKLQGKLYMASQLEITGAPKIVQLVTVIPFSAELKEKLQASIILGANTLMTANWFFDLQSNKWAAIPFSSSAARLPYAQLKADQIVRSDDHLLVATGKAKITNRDQWLMAPRLIVDARQKLVHCDSECTLSRDGEQWYNSPVTLDVKKEGWKLLEQEK